MYHATDYTFRTWLKAPLKCWERKIRQNFDGKISLKLYHNVKEDVI